MKEVLTSLRAGALATCAALLIMSPSQARSDDSGADIAARYGVRPSVMQISLSPSGQKVAWIAAGPQHSEILHVVNLAKGGEVRQVIVNSEPIGDLERCEWATETRLVCSMFGMAVRSDGVLLPFDRVFAIDEDGGEPTELSERRDRLALGFAQDGGTIVALDVAGEEGQVLMTRQWVKEYSTGTRLANSKEGLGVDRIDVDSGRRRIDEQPDNGAARYIADETGRLRLKTRVDYDSVGRLTDERFHYYRGDGSDRWLRLDSVKIDNAPVEDFRPVAVDAGRGSIFGFIDKGGYKALAEVPLTDPAQGRIVFARDDVDVGSLIQIGRQRRVVGVSYATEKRSISYFDDELATLAENLGKALPDTPQITIAGASADETKLLVIASSDTDPGMVYLYDTETRQLEQLLAMREHLADQPMGKMRPITFPAADGTQIPGYLTLPPGSDGKNLPAIVLPHGGPAARDVWGFDWLVQFLAARGYAVLQPNYRGSSGYGEEWFGRNGFQAWDVAIGDVNDAGRWLVSEGIADPAQLAVVGWSYGGYAALQSQVVAPDLYLAIVAIAPVTDLGYLRTDARAYTNSALVRDYVGDGPHLAAGSPLQHAERFAAPVALFHATRDLNVDVRHSRAMADRLEDAGKRVTYTEYDDLQHDLGDSKVRAEMLTAIDDFLSAALDR